MEGNTSTDKVVGRENLGLQGIFTKGLSDGNGEERDESDEYKRVANITGAGRDWSAEGMSYLRSVNACLPEYTRSDKDPQVTCLSRARIYRWRHI